MQQLNLPTYQFRIQIVEGKQKIFDQWRKKFVVLTNEEWVRQNFIRFLVEDKNFPDSLIAIETGLKVVKRNKRTDAVVYSRSGRPIAIVECKAPEIELNEEVFDQIIRYNMTLQVPYLMVTNGLIHICCMLDYESYSVKYLREIPNFNSIEV
ncbi:MAG: type I restriction enzyme HsdR N-terminal domain-containing protein [Bacteroidales bacterium]